MGWGDHADERARIALVQQRDVWKRLFNRLDAAIARHRSSPLFMDEADDALHAAHDRVLAEATEARPS